MRNLLLGAVAVLAACAADSKPAPDRRPTSDVDAAALCAAQRAENRHRAESLSCSRDEDCVRAGQYETGTCDAWVAQLDAAQVRQQMRAATDAACRDMRSVLVTPACRGSVGVCVAGRCAAKPGDDAAVSAVDVVPVVPRDFQCLADALGRVTEEKKKVPAGPVALRFPLIPDRPPRYFEATAPVHPDTALAVARAFGACLWKPASGAPISPGTWGTMNLVVQE
jgi:hypothetical protein